MAIKILDQDLELEELEVNPDDMLLKDAIALKSLYNVLDVPHFYVIKLDEPLAFVMSYHKGDTMRTLLRSGDI